MTYFREVDFHFQTSMDPSVVNHLFDQRVKNVDVDDLSTKLKEQGNIFNKKGKDIKQMKSVMDYSDDNFKRAKIDISVWEG